MLKLNLTNWKVTYDYFLDHSGPHTMVIGFYSTVLLHSLALGLDTYAFYDPIFNFSENTIRLF